MPAMTFFGRQWKLASDALGIPAIFAALARTVWTAVVLAFFMGLQLILSRCRRRIMVDTFISLSAAVFLAILVVEISVVVVASRGSIVETHARKGVGRLVYFHFLLGVAEAGLAILGASIIVQPSGSVQCDEIWRQYRVDLIVALVAMSQLADVMLRACCCVVMAGSREAHTTAALPIYEPHPLTHVEQRWQGRCRMMCTCLRWSTCSLFSSGDDLGDLQTVARVFADVFHSEGILDVTASDVLAGMVLLRHVQKAQEHELVSRAETSLNDGPLDNSAAMSRTLNLSKLGASATPHVAAPIPPQPRDDLDASSTTLARGGAATRRVRLQSGHYIARQLLQPDSVDDRSVLEEGAYFELYALAIYSWMMYTVDKGPCSGLSQLLWRRIRMKPRITERGVMRAVVGDNWFRSHEAAMLNFLGDRQVEVAYADLKNSIYHRPYALLIDHKWQCVVLTIRGTLSLEDLMVDANTEAVPLDEVGREWGFPGEGMFCHGGFLNSADVIVKDLLRHRLLHNLLLQGGRSGASPPATPATPLTASTRGYSLRVVGHSLGAGAAQLVALMLRRDFPDLRCLCYGPPGPIVSPALADYCKPFMLSFVLGRDLVARMSVAAVTKLRDDILTLVARCKVNKMEVFRSVVQSRAGYDARATVNRMLHPLHQIPPSPLLEQIKAWEEHTRQAEQRREHPRMAVGGRMVYFIKSHTEAVGCCSSKQCYTPTWVCPEDLCEICVASSMLLDHFPNRYQTVMEGVARDFGIDLGVSGTAAAAPDDRV